MSQTIITDIEGCRIGKGDKILVFDVYAKVTNIRMARGNGGREPVVECEDEYGNKFIGYSEEIYLVQKAGG